MKNVNRQNYYWTSLCFSLVLPGSGHFLLRRYKQGTFFLLLYILIYVTLQFFLFLPGIHFYLYIILFGIVRLIYPLYVSFANYKILDAESAESEACVRRKWIAGFLTLLWPGLGHLYLCKIITGVIFACLFSLYFFVTPLSFVWFLLVRIIAFYHLLVFYDSLQPKLFIMQFCLFLAVVSTIKYKVVPVMRSRYICYVTILDGDSMAPVMSHQGHYVVDKITFRFQEPRVGDIVAFECDIGNLNAIKRIVATEGEVVEIIDRKLYINGVLRYSYSGCNDNQEEVTLYCPDPYYQPFSRNYVVPKGSFYVIGDNFHNSVGDSRSFGAVEKQNIIGKVSKELWPRYQSLYRGSDLFLKNHSVVESDRRRFSVRDDDVF